MADEPADIPVQTPRAWAHFRYVLGAHVPMRVGQIQLAGKRIRAIGTSKQPAPKGK